MKPIVFEPFKDKLKTALDAQFDSFLNEKHCSATATFRVDLADLFKDIPKAKIVFQARAYLKMMMLVQRSDKELAAHGTVYRKDGFFIVEDLMVYPQHVTGATVRASDEYGPWLHELPDEEFNHLRFQFHSHVNFSTNPSGTDDDWYKDMLKDVEDFYVFMIFNKRGERWINIYDVENNLIYENEDVVVDVLFDDGIVGSDWLEESFLYIDTRTYGEVKGTVVINQDETLEDKWRRAEAEKKANPNGKKKRGRPVGSVRMTGLNTDTPPLGSSAADDYQGNYMGNRMNCYYLDKPTKRDCDSCLDQFGYHPCVRGAYE